MWRTYRKKKSLRRTKKHNKTGGYNSKEKTLNSNNSNKIIKDLFNELSENESITKKKIETNENKIELLKMHLNSYVDNNIGNNSENIKTIEDSIEKVINNENINALELYSSINKLLILLKNTVYVYKEIDNLKKKIKNLINRNNNTKQELNIKKNKDFNDFNTLLNSVTNNKNLTGEQINTLVKNFTNNTSPKTQENNNKKPNPDRVELSNPDTDTPFIKMLNAKIEKYTDFLKKIENNNTTIQDIQTFIAKSKKWRK